MKNSNYSQYTEEGLRIVDEDNVSFETDEENELYHQEMQDLHINHASELAAERYFRKLEEDDYYVFGKLHPYGYDPISVCDCTPSMSPWITEI